MGLEVGFGLGELVGDRKRVLVVVMRVCILRGLEWMLREVVGYWVDKCRMEEHFQARALDLGTQMVVKKMVNSHCRVGRLMNPALDQCLSAL